MLGKKVLAGIGVILVVVFSGYYYFTFAKGEELSIASFEKEVMDEDISNYVSIYIQGYGITGNEVWVRGTVNYTGPPDSHLAGSQANIGMAIRESGDKNLDVDVYYTSGELIFSGVNPPMDTDSETVPHLGGLETSYPSSFDFFLSCSYNR